MALLITIESRALFATKKYSFYEGRYNIAE